MSRLLEGGGFSEMASRGLRHKSTRLSSSIALPAEKAEEELIRRPNEASITNGSSQTLLDTWIEPPLRHPAPSFEDNKGLERVGVLEHMAPLGQPPTQKLLQRLKLYPPKPSQRATPVQSEEVTTPTTDVEGMETASPADRMRRSESVKTEDMDTKPNKVATKSKRLGENAIQKAEVGMVSPSRTMVSPTSVRARRRSSLYRSQQPIPAEIINAHVEAAIREAEVKSSLGLVAGLRNLQNEANSDPALWTVLDAVLHKSPTRKQFKTFRRHIKAGIAKYEASSSLNSNTRSRPLLNTGRLASTPPQPTHSSPTFSTSTFRSPANPLSPNSVAPLPFHLSRPSPTVPSFSATRVSAMAKATSSRLTNGEIDDAEGATDVQPATRKGRSGSVSSSSSLSSAKSLDPEDFAPTIEVDGRAQVNGSKAARSARQAKSRVAAGSNNTKTRTALPPPSKNPYSTFNSVSKFPPKSKKKDDAELDQESIRVRQDLLLRQSIYDYDLETRPESHEREEIRHHAHPSSITAITAAQPVIHLYSQQQSSAALSSPTEAQPPTERTLRNGTSRKRSRNEQENDDEAAEASASSSPPPFLAPPPPGAAGSSRAGTPRGPKLPPSKKAKKSARVMVSPNKPKNGAITAGIQRAGTAKDPTIGNGVDDSEEEHDEYCAACGGYGELLCCDGCPNVFHGTCLEPPVDTQNPPDVQWFCPRCVARQTAPVVETTGIFGRLVRRMEESNPRAFNLPYEIREYFEGVKTGDEGEYEEVCLPRTQNNPVKMNRAGFIEEPNYKELRDSKNNFITCYRCNLTSNGRDIIPCDYCPARWHLDCLDPPLAVPPRRRKDHPNATWRCPLHLEHDLAAMDRADEAAPHEIGRMPRLRKPRNAVPYDVSMSRGFKNNGLIDIVLMKEEEPDFKEVEMDGTIYRLPELGIRLDFIDRVKRSWYEDQTYPDKLQAPKILHSSHYRPSPDVAESDWGHSNPTADSKIDNTATQASQPSTAYATLRARSFAEQQAVLNLRLLSRSEDKLSTNDGANLPESSLSALVDTLVSEAPPDAVQAIQRGERTCLEQLNALIQRRLAMIPPAGDAAATQSSPNGVDGHDDAGRDEDTVMGET